MTQTVVVENVLWQGDYGGAIFNAVTLAGQRHRFLAKPAVMPRPPVPGEVWKISGKRRLHHHHGSQVHTETALLLKPSGKIIISTLSKSKSFPGIGQARALKLWNKLGETIYALLDTGDPTPFEEILGTDIAHVLTQGWRALSTETDVYQYLDWHGLPISLCGKLIAIYENAVIEKLEDNPYRLLAFTSWRQTDQVARSIGIEAHDTRRLIAAAEAVGYQRLSSGHTVTKTPEFKARVCHLLGCNNEVADRAVELALAEHAIVEGDGGLQGVGPASMERFIAERLASMISGNFAAKQSMLRIPANKALDGILTGFEDKEAISLNLAQRAAVETALSAPVSIITGGAGVGKTTVLKAIHEATERLGGHIYQMALAGRAAKRMTEATNRPARTLMSFLQACDTGQINLGTEPIIVIDEASMVDLPIMFRIFRRMEPGCRLLLVGDPAQLPPIGFGLVFHSLCANNTIPRVELTVVHRQAASTGIPQVSGDIRNGIIPTLRDYCGKGGGVSFIDCTTDEITDAVLDVTRELGGIGETQIIGAVKNGPAGTRTINEIFHALQSQGRRIRVNYAEGEPVIWTANDYKLDLMNGSLGTVVSAKDHLDIMFDGEMKTIPDDSVVDMDYAYAITCHKSQGSQFGRVIIPVVKSRLLDRTLLYTAVTRAQEQVVLIGDRDAFHAAVTGLPLPNRREVGLSYLL